MVRGVKEAFTRRKLIEWLKLTKIAPFEPELVILVTAARGHVAGCLLGVGKQGALGGFGARTEFRSDRGKSLRFY